jgi:hypothetical protein
VSYCYWKRSLKMMRTMMKTHCCYCSMTMTMTINCLRNSTKNYSMMTKMRMNLKTMTGLSLSYLTMKRNLYSTNCYWTKTIVSLNCYYLKTMS